MKSILLLSLTLTSCIETEKCNYELYQGGVIIQKEIRTCQGSWSYAGTYYKEIGKVVNGQ